MTSIAGITATAISVGKSSIGMLIPSISKSITSKIAVASGTAIGTIVGVSTIGVGLFVGGKILSVAGAKVKEKSTEAYNIMLENEEDMNNVISYLDRVNTTANELRFAIEYTHEGYMKYVKKFIELVDKSADWSTYTNDEQLIVDNMIRIVSILYKMINTPLLRITKTDLDGNPTEVGLDYKAAIHAVDSSKNIFNVIDYSD